MDEEQASVPIVDFARYLKGAPAEQQEVARSIDRAFRTVGFVYLSNHTVPQEKVNQCLKWSQQFFNLPYEDKMKAPHPPGASHHRGYSGMGKEKVSQMVFDRSEIEQLRKAAPDVKESFESGNVNDTYQPNIWPPEDTLPGFRTFMESFFEDCARLIHSILTCLAVSLGLKDSALLTDPHSECLYQLRLLHYPALPTAALHSGTQRRISAHSDFGSITLLFQDSVGGLEIEDARRENAGVFRSVAPRPDCVLVNVGDLLERWSNGRWKSTVHRVGAPRVLNGASADAAVVSEDATTPDRYSIPIFAAPGPDAVIEALPGCYGPENPERWEKISAGEYIQMRMDALY